MFFIDFFEAYCLAYLNFPKLLIFSSLDIIIFGISFNCSIIPSKKYFHFSFSISINKVIYFHFSYIGKFLFSIKDSNIIYI